MGLNHVMIKPEDNFHVHFKEASLNMIGLKETLTHGRTSRLYYRIDERPGSSEKINPPYAVEFNTLKRTFQECPTLDIKAGLVSRISQKMNDVLGLEQDYCMVDYFTGIRRTIQGGLEIRRMKPSPMNNFKDRTIFSEGDFNLLKKYLGAVFYMPIGTSHYIPKKMNMAVTGCEMGFLL